MFNLLILISCGLLFQPSLCEDKCKKVSPAKPQAQLVKEYFMSCGYNTKASPLQQSGTTTHLNITLLLHSIYVDEYFSSFYMHGWFVWEWTDARLQWDPSQFGGVDLLHLDTEEIWVPKLEHYWTTPSWRETDFFPNGRCNVKSNGSVVCVTETGISTHCSPEYVYWPYDKLHCYMELFAISNEIAVYVPYGLVNVVHYTEDNDWDLLSAISDSYVDKLHTNKTFSWIKYSFDLQRHSSHYKATFTLPGLACAFLVLVTLWMEATDFNRMKIACISLLCHSLQLHDVISHVHNNGPHIPLLVQFYSISMVFTGIELVFSIILQLLMKMQSAPAWLMKATTLILSHQIPQKLLKLELPKQEKAATTENGGGGDEEEGDGLVKIMPPDAHLCWTMFGKMLDIICFTVFSNFYLWLMLIGYFV